MRSSHSAAVVASTGRSGRFITVFAMITVVAMAMMSATPTSSWQALADTNAHARNSTADSIGCTVRRCDQTRCRHA